ncbi:MAG: hypothetical protein M3167_04715 [Acidobacteriota bacterium]|nr:hypothetical protein [Acidobacteriota bacterium]
MKRLTAAALVFAAAALAQAAAPPEASVTPAASSAASSARPLRTFCAEWVRQSREGYQRLTLFADRTLVWKRSRSGKDDLLRREIASEELDYYCSFFGRPEVWAAEEDARTGLSGDFTVQSSITLVRPDGTRKTFRFDDLSPLPGETAAVRAALEGLRTSMTSPLAPASRFAPDTLSEGQVLKRFDGAFFRIVKIEREKGVVELEGVREPYRQFRKIDELRFQFAPPQ